uniref:DDE-1 domain-containing protein n=1 Tax=Rhizophagus irregularis (strain DAOM 181602 / DAOM 197198 / MUCL 43194) TaxID=747089 RepID=U9TAP3_RHIID
MLRENRQLIDNARCHESENINSLSNVKVHFLPPNTTSFLQPLDQGIIYSLKAQYRKLLCQNRIQAYDFYEDMSKITEDDNLQMMNVNQEVDQEVATSQHQEVNVQEVTSSQNSRM